MPHLRLPRLKFPYLRLSRLRFSYLWLSKLRFPYLRLSRLRFSYLWLSKLRFPCLRLSRLSLSQLRLARVADASSQFSALCRRAIRGRSWRHRCAFAKSDIGLRRLSVSAALSQIIFTGCNHTTLVTSTLVTSSNPIAIDLLAGSAATARPWRVHASASRWRQATGTRCIGRCRVRVRKIARTRNALIR